MLELFSTIKGNLEKGSYKNERAVEQQIVFPILKELGWDINNPSQIEPQYELKWQATEKGKKVEKRRVVDYALLVDKKARVIIEVKAVGNLEAADSQLFEYAFHAGTPLAVLTDGREWRVYYSYGTGNYNERLVRTLDLCASPHEEVAKYLSRYLVFEEVRLGHAEKNARADLENQKNIELVKKSIPTAWSRIVSEPDIKLVNLLIRETAQEASGIAPNKDDVIAFLKSLALPPEMYSLPRTSTKLQSATHKPRRKTTKGSISYKLLGETKTSSTHIDAYVDIIDSLARRDPSFLDRLAPKFGETQLSRHTQFHNSKRIYGGWYLNRDLGGRPKEERLKIACEVAGITYGRDLIIDFSVSAEPQSVTSQFPQEPAPSPFFNARDKQSAISQFPKKTASYTFSTSIGNKKLNAIQAYMEIMGILARRDPDFLNRLALELGEKYLSRDIDFRESVKIEGWFFNKILSNDAKARHLDKACKVAGIEFGKGLIINFPTSAKSQNVSYTLETSDAIQAYVEVMDSLARRDPDFLNRLALELGEKHLLRTTDFREFEKTSWRQVKIYGDWFLNKVLSNDAKKRHLIKACKVAGIEFGKDLIINFSASAEPQSTTSHSSEESFSKKPFYVLFGKKYNKFTYNSQAYVHAIKNLSSHHRTPSNFLSLLIDKLNNPRLLSKDESKMHSSKKLDDGWFVDTGTNTEEKKRILKEACTVAGIEFGKDLIINFPNTKKKRRK